MPLSMIEFTKQPIDSNAVLASVSTPDAGANVLFLGTTRQFTKGLETVQLDYEGYEAMVLKEFTACLLYTSPSPRDQRGSRMPSSA